MNQKAKFYSDKVLVASVAAAALGVVLLNTTKDVKADQVVQPPVNKTSTKQTPNKIVPVANTNNNDITDNSLKQADNEDKTNQPSVSIAPSLPPKKAIKTVDDLVLPKSIKWKSTSKSTGTDGKESDIILTLKSANDPQNPDACELDISGGTINNPQTLQSVFSTNDDYKKIHTIKITDSIKIIGSAAGLFEKLSELKQIDGLDKIDTSSVTDIRRMFADCSALTSLDLSNFDISADVKKVFLFKNCTNLNTLKLGQKFTANGNNISLPDPIWYKVGNGTLVRPEDGTGHQGSWFNDFDGSTDADTYVRLNLDDENHTSTIAGNITINYFDQDGNKINLPESSKLSQPCQGLLGGTITPEPEITDANGVKYHLIKDDSRNSKNVTFTEQPQDNVKFYYEKVPGGDITVHYVDKDDKEIQSSEQCHGAVGEKLTPKADLTDANGVKYHLIKDDSRNSKNVTFTEQAQPDIKFYYEKVPGGAITVHYVDKDDKEIQSSEQCHGAVGEKLTPKADLTDANGVKYHLIKDDSHNKNVTFTDQAQDNVKFYYEKVPGGDITVHYVDKDNKEIQSSEQCHGAVGEKLTPKADLTDANGVKYRLIKDDSRNKNVTFTDQAQDNVKFYYEKVPGGDITVHYVDKDDKEIQSSEQCHGAVGEKLTPKADLTDANGVKYHLIENDSRNSENVTFTEQPQDNVKFYYEKVSTNSPNTGSNNSNILGGDVTVHYQDEEGHSLAPDEIIKGHLGAGYVSRTLQISGYSLKTRPEQATGFFTSDPQSITYVYTLDEAKISKRLMHNAFIYDLHHQRVGKHKFYSYERIMVYPKLVTLTDGVRAYKLADNQYVLAANIDGTLRKLKHSAYIYQTGKKRANRLVLRKGKIIRTYGAPYQFKNGKLYYRIGGPKKQYVKVNNFK